MRISKFCNPHGLPHPQASSNAEDLACLVSECLKIELFKTEFFLNEVVSLEFSEECLYKLYTKDSEFYVNIDRLSRHCEDKLEKIFNLVMQKASFYSRELEEA